VYLIFKRYAPPSTCPLYASLSRNYIPDFLFRSKIALFVRLDFENVKEKAIPVTGFGCP
jgi:hypothetical protein